MSRGDRGGAVFEDDADREMFLETLGQACSKTGGLFTAIAVICSSVRGDRWQPQPPRPRGVQVLLPRNFCYNSDIRLLWRVLD